MINALNRGGRFHILLALALVPPLPQRAEAQQADNSPAVIPVGLDAYRQWDRWPYLRIGERAYMRSTYDRRGGNEGADASHFLYQLADDSNVTLDIAGPGILYFARYNHWHGSPWRYVVDGKEHIVRETGTKNPLKPVENSLFEPSDLFPQPLAFTWSVTQGADLSWAPIAFERSFRMAYSRTHYGTGYYIFHQFVPGIELSRPIRSWDGRTPPDRDVLDLINRSAEDLAPRAGDPGVQAVGGDSIKLGANAALLLKSIEPAEPMMLRALEFSCPRDQAAAFGRTRLRVTWDGRAEPSIDAPLALFFGTGTLFNRDNREHLVKAFPVSVRFAGERVHLACSFPMPFFRSAKIELLGNGSSDLDGIRWGARNAPYRDRPNRVGYFHATYRDHAAPVRGRDLVLLDTREIEGGGDWSGHIVGTSFIFSDRANLNTLEGDPRFFLDDSSSPQGQGTGTEEWGGGGDYWGGRNMTLPFAGHPVGAVNEKSARSDEDKIESAYRFLLADLIPFGRNAVFHLEHGGNNDSTEHYRTLTYWYGRAGASLVKTDTLQIGDPDAEAKHGYESPQASAPYEIRSRYEWGPDSVSGMAGIPDQRDTGRKTTGTSELTLALDPKNVGVLLRRKLDYALPNQRAEVSLADRGGEWKAAGVWYLAGSNTCVYSNPKGELDPPQHVVQTSNRRFREDEFLLPKALTAGRDSIRLRLKFTPTDIPLFPGRPVGEQAWSEIRYDAYCFVVPK